MPYPFSTSMSVDTLRQPKDFGPWSTIRDWDIGLDPI